MICRLPLLRLLLVCLLVFGLVRTSPTEAAKQLDPDLVPPDVTMPSTSHPVAAVPSPGMEGATGQQGQPKMPGAQPPSGGTTVGGPVPNPQNLQKPDPIAIIETEKGNISIRLFRHFAPKTVENFIDLAGKGFYNGLVFHRVEAGFCIQGGDPNGNGSGVYFEPGTQNIRLLQLETSPSLKHNAAGVVAMARFPKNPNTASCQFYITLAPQPKLDGNYSIFGGVTSGMEVVNAIVKGDKMLKVSVQEQPE
jgi:peptidyl-prolyl cis-trans isomerase B (cyclophilin B)